jgi:hypothetical protein
MSAAMENRELIIIIKILIALIFITINYSCNSVFDEYCERCYEKDSPVLTSNNKYYKDADECKEDFDLMEERINDYDLKECYNLWETNEPLYSCLNEHEKCRKAYDFIDSYPKICVKKYKNNRKWDGECMIALSR